MRFQGKEKGVEKQHISLAWHKTQLLSSTIRGELLSWTLWPGSAKYKVVKNSTLYITFFLVIMNHIHDI